MSTYRRRLLTNQALRVAKGDLIYPNLVAAWSAKGKTNEDEDRNVLKDLTGHGHDITLNNMAFNNQESGYGGYKNYALGTENEVKITSVDNRINVVVELGYKVTGFKKGDTITASVDCEAYNINFEQNSKISIQFGPKYAYNSLNKDIIDNGNIHLTRKIVLNNHSGSSDPVTELDDGLPCIRFDYITFNEGGYFLVKNFTVVKGENEVEWFKDYQYPDALVLDGIDDYGACENMPILNDFTIIVKRKYNNGESGIILKAGNSNTFILEGGNNPGSVWTFGKQTFLYYYEEDISYLTPSNYNGLTVNKGESPDKNSILTLGTIRLGDGRHWAGAFYSAYLFNKSLEESEIKSFIRKYIDAEYLLPSEIPTPDCYYDFSLGSNEDENPEIIKDQSGNGNDAKAYNFAWSGMSGYGGYSQDYSKYSNCKEKTYNKLTLSGGHWAGSVNVNNYNNVEYTINISGSTGYYIYYILVGTGNVTKYSLELKEGLNTIPKFSEDILSQSSMIYINCNSIPADSLITVEQLPLYKNALVLDGVDDYIALEAFDSGFKTVFMLCTPFTLGKILYDLRNAQRFAIFNKKEYDGYGSGIAAYYGRADETCNVYINNTLNDRNNGITTDKLIDKKQLITVTTYGTIDPTSFKINIGSNKLGDDYFADMAIYKFLGFKEELTDDLILYVIKKYNLLDGVDDLSVIDEISNDTLISNETLIQN